MMLMSMRFVFLAGLSIHVIAGVWYSLSCYNVEDDRAQDVSGVCKTNTWVQYTGINVCVCVCVVATSQNVICVQI